MTPDPDDSRRWLDDDAALRAAADDRRESDVAVSDLVPAEWAGISLLDRLRAACGRRIAVTVTDGVTVDGLVVEVGATWLLMSSPTVDTVIALAELVSLTGVGSPTPDAIATRLLGPGTVWREWARGQRRARWALKDGRLTTGSVWRVGSDALDLVQHPLDRVARAADQRVVIPFTSIRWAASPN